MSNPSLDRPALMNLRFQIPGQPVSEVLVPLSYIPQHENNTYRLHVFLCRSKDHQTIRTYCPRILPETTAAFTARSPSKMPINPLGRNWGSLVNWDTLGKAYAGFVVAWTCIILAGMVWLILNRRLPFVKMRNLPLALASTIFLHVYLVKIMLAYTTNGHFLCSVEFWIMNIYLPCGIALFQANLTQLKSISVQQQRMYSPRPSLSTLSSSVAPTLRRGGLQGFRERWAELPDVRKSYVFIGLGIVLQVRHIHQHRCWHHE